MTNDEIEQALRDANVGLTQTQIEAAASSVGAAMDRLSVPTDFALPRIPGRVVRTFRATSSGNRPGGDS